MVSVSIIEFITTSYPYTITSSLLLVASFLTYWTLPARRHICGIDARTCILTRRSIPSYTTEKKVPPTLVQRAVEAAILAPNHHLTEPWRYYNCGPRTLEAMASYLEPIDPKAAMTLRTTVPHIMVVTQYSRDGVAYNNESGNTVTELEDRAAVAASIQNFMLSLHADGVGSKWITGAMKIPDEVVLGLVGADGEVERLVANVWYGFAADAVNPDAPERALGVDGILTELE